MVNVTTIFSKPNSPRVKNTAEYFKKHIPRPKNNMGTRFVNNMNKTRV